MNFKPGDRVKFLNLKGGGVVAKIIDSRLVAVVDEGGFEIPTLISELVKMGDSDPGARYFDESFDPAAIENGLPEEAPESERSHELPSFISRNRKSEEIFLAFIPHEQKWLISGLLDVYLINNSSYDLLYNLFVDNGEGGFKGKDYGSCFMDSKLLLASISREQLPDWTSGYLQFLFHKEDCQTVLPPFNSEFRISGQKFYNESSYKESGFLSEKAITVKVLSVTDYLKQLATPPKEQRISSVARKEDEPLIFKYQTKPREAVVDLHITELLDDAETMRKEEILDFQISCFEQCLDSAIFNHFLRVTFIHGVGNGILREALLLILKKQEGIEIFDAPMQKYGVGAIEVRIPHNR
jgi:hypothetical protein